MSLVSDSRYFRQKLAKFLTARLSVCVLSLRVAAFRKVTATFNEDLLQAIKPREQR